MPITPVIVLRNTKGSELTYTEADSNFANLRDGVTQTSSSVETLNDLVDQNYSTLSGSIFLLGGRVTTAEQDIDDIQTTILNHEDRLDQAELDITTNYNELEGDITALSLRIDAVELFTTSAFEYVGTISAGTELSPFDLNTLTKKHAGAYYKVISSGFVTYSSVAKQVNPNDGIIFNGSSSYDVIDSSDPISSGTTDYISVTGNADSGFSIDIDSAFKQRMTDAESSISDHETRIDTLESTSTTLLYATKASGRASFTTTDPDQIVDSFDSTVLKTAKYVIQAELTDGSMHASEILVTNNATTVFITEYAKLNNGTDLVTYSADFNGTLVELYATPVNANTTITFARTAIKKA